ncbi:hypothetical protein FA95DRAFT_1596607 [Auriscalpium vulgare]|uniref:Uncharacterized protein n=1 Tax=Auriscalpium vulgare TaxID=40419 RepID=A0ACB8RPY5_9AGAM|nr:hypothetical protein FA95DRAFT_1596607 [Auriscalpium vulgare]
MADATARSKFAQRTRGPVAPALPVEVLLKIFSMTKRRSYFDMVASHTLPKLARVSKSWLPVARELLYTSIYLGSAVLPRTASRLQRTLESSPNLKAMVRAIYFGTMDSDEKGGTHALAGLVALCGPINLRKLHLFGYGGGEALVALREAMHGAVRLQKLVIIPRDMRDNPCVRFATVSQFFGMMQSWPELRAIRLYQHVLSWNDENSNSEDTEIATEEERAAAEMKVWYPVRTGALSVLESIDDRYNFMGKDILALAQIAPNISSLTADLHILFTAPGVFALKALPRLTHIHINGSLSFPNSLLDKFGAQVAAALASLPALEHLEVSSAWMVPGVFTDAQSFPALKQLDYRIRKDTDEIHVLTDMLRMQPRRLPELKRLAVMTGSRAIGGFARPMEFKEGVYQALKDACVHRVVRLQEHFDSEMEGMAAQLQVSEEDVRDECELKADVYSDDDDYDDDEGDDDEGNEDEDDDQDSGELDEEENAEDGEDSEDEDA